MPATRESLRDFARFTAGLKGDEKGEAQTFVDRLMRLFGHEDAVEAGGTFEHRIKTPPKKAAQRPPGSPTTSSPDASSSR